MDKLILNVNRAGEDFIEEWLWSCGALSVSRDADHIDDRTMTALFDGVERETVESSLTQSPDLVRGEITAYAWETVDPDAWQERWRDAFQPIEAGPFSIVPAWHDGPRDHPHQLRIYPGQAFGTGQHETTRLVLTRMAELDFKGKRVLDIGCGTGILSVAAERLGAADVFGFDADPDCRENMAYHLELNNSERVKLEIGVFDDFQFEPFDVILANITLNVLTEIWPRLSVILKPGGILLNSGILDEQQQEALTNLHAAGFQPGELRQLGEWLLIEAKRI